MQEDDLLREWRETVTRDIQLLTQQVQALALTMQTVKTEMAQMRRQPGEIRDWLSLGAAAMGGCLVPTLVALFAALTWIVTHLSH